MSRAGGDPAAICFCNEAALLDLALEAVVIAGGGEDDATKNFAGARQASSAIFLYN